MEFVLRQIRNFKPCDSMSNPPINNSDEREYAHKSITAIANDLEQEMEETQPLPSEQLPILPTLILPSKNATPVSFHIPSPTVLFPNLYNETVPDSPVILTPKTPQSKYKRLDISRFRLFTRKHGTDAYNLLCKKLDEHDMHNAKPAEGDFVVLRKNGVKVSKHSLLELKSTRMIDDEVINYCFKDFAYKSLSIKKKNYYGSTFFYPALKTSKFSEVKSWLSKNAIRKYLSKFNANKHELGIESVYDFELLFFPIHLGLHWTLAVFNVRMKTACYLDSLGSRDTSILCEIEEYLNKISVIDNKPEICFKKLCLNENIQQNGVDCGVYVLLNTYILKQSSYKRFSAYDVHCFRKFLYVKFLMTENQYN